ncbi:MAG: hypothetical protein WBQ17_07930 [Rhizomicrobium sp.]|jgi:hypothetical protein
MTEREDEEMEDAPHPIEALIAQRPLEAVIASVLIGVLLGRLLF